MPTMIAPSRRFHGGRRRSVPQDTVQSVTEGEATSKRDAPRERLRKPLRSPGSQPIRRRRVPASMRDRSLREGLYPTAVAPALPRALRTSQRGRRGAQRESQARPRSKQRVWLCNARERLKHQLAARRRRHVPRKRPGVWPTRHLRPGQESRTWCHGMVRRGRVRPLSHRRAAI